MEQVKAGLLAGMSVRDRPFRIPDLDPAAFTPEQARAAAEIMGILNRDHPTGPFRVLVRLPQVMHGMAQLLQSGVASSALGKRLNRLSAIIVSRHWSAQYEWFVQAKEAAVAGIAPEIVEDIRLGRRPVFSKADEQLVYDTISELSGQRGLSDESFQRARAGLGDDALAELVANAGFYTMVGMVISAFGILAPEPAEANPLPELGKQ